jgi:hypothetical protein
MILRDMTEKQLADMKKRCMIEWKRFRELSLGREDHEDIWKKAFSHGLRAGFDIAPHVKVKDWKAVRKE